MIIKMNISKIIGTELVVFHLNYPLKLQLITTGENKLQDKRANAEQQKYSQRVININLM
jgi:hypothetical protein